MQANTLEHTHTTFQVALSIGHLLCNSLSRFGQQSLYPLNIKHFSGFWDFMEKYPFPHSRNNILVNEKEHKLLKC